MACTFAPCNVASTFAGRFDTPVLSGYESSKLASILPSLANTTIPTGYPVPSTYERFGNFAGYPSTIDAAIYNNARFGNFAGYPSTFDARFNSYPSTFDARFNGYPSVYERMAASGLVHPSVYERMAASSGLVHPSVYERMAAGYGYPMGWERLAGAMPWTHNVPSTWAAYNNWANNTWSNKWMTGLEGTTPSHFDMTFNNVAFRPSSSVEYYTLTNPIRVLDREGNRQLCLCYELKGFKPEEVIVTLNKAERAVIVEAAHEIKEGKEHQISRKFSRKFVLPESLAKIDLTKVELKSCLTTEGYLIIEAVLPKMTAEEIAKCPVMSKVNEVPLHFHGLTNSFGGCPTWSNVNNVRPVTVKTA